MVKKKRGKREIKHKTSLKLNKKTDIFLFVLIISIFFLFIKKSWVVETDYFKTDGTKGHVSLVYLVNSDCNQCADLTEFVESLKSTGIEIINENVVEFSSVYGKELVKKYNIEKIPTIIMNQEAGSYENIRAGWTIYGTVDNGFYVLRKITPPYYNVKKGRIGGLVNAVFLTDESCKECYDVNLHDLLLDSIDIKFNKKEFVDISEPEGQELVEKYNIIFVPTIILSNEVEDYYSASLVFEQFYSKETDGFYVFRNFEEWKGVNYKDLSTGEIKSS